MNSDFVNNRIDSVAQLRSILISCRDQNLYLSDYLPYIKQLHEPLKTQLKELRSVMVRQISQTVCFWAEVYTTEIEHTIEAWINAFIPILTQNKVMSSNASHAIKFLFMTVHSPRLIQCILDGIVHKHAAVRRACTEDLYHICVGWAPELLEKFSKQLIVLICKAVKDSDPDVRSLARHTFWGFHGVFPALANSYLSKEDKKTQTLLIDFKKAQSPGEPISIGDLDVQKKTGKFTFSFNEAHKSRYKRINC
jgi:hypothetical protein